MTTTQLAIVSAVAAEIDRLVVRAHELAYDYPDKPEGVDQVTALPHLLNTAGIILLARPLTRDEVKGIVPYTPESLIDGLIDNNVAEGIVSEADGGIVLTDSGRAAAEGVVGVQEAAVARASSGARGDEHT